MFPRGDEDSVEISGIHLPVGVPTGPSTPSQATETSDGKPFLRIFYSCANAYTRAYKSADGQAYLATCPRCGKQKQFAVGSGGTDQRAFELSCRL